MRQRRNTLSTWLEQGHYFEVVTAYINVRTGDITECYASPVIGNIYNDMDKPLKFEAIGKCSVAYCYIGHEHLTFGVVPS